MTYFVLMCYSHSISSPSLTLPTNTTLILHQNAEPFCVISAKEVVLYVFIGVS